MNKNTILLILAIFLIINSFIVYAQNGDKSSSYSDMNRDEQQEYLNNMGFSDVTPDDVGVSNDGNTITIKSTGRQIDVSKISGTKTIKVSEGGNIKDSTGNEFVFDKGSGDVQLVNGKIVINNAVLKEGSKIENVPVSGHVASYKEGAISNEAGKSVVIDGKKYTSESGSSFIFELDSNYLSTYGKDVTIEYRGEKVTINGRASIEDFRNIIVYAAPNRPSSFTTPKGTKIKVHATTLFIQPSSGAYYDYFDENKITSASEIIYNGNLRIKAKEGNSIIVNANDGIHEDIFVEKINENAVVDLYLSNNDGSRVFFKFGKNPPIQKGDISNLQTNVGTIFNKEGEDWTLMVYQGGKATSKWVGESNFRGNIIDLIEHIDQDSKKTMLASVHSIPHKDIHNLMYHSYDKESQKLILSKVSQLNSQEATSLLDNAFDEEIQKELIAKMGEDVFNKDDISIALRNAKTATIQKIILDKTNDGVIWNVNEDFDIIMAKRALENAKDESIARIIIDKVSDEKGIKTAFMISLAKSDSEISDLIEKIPRNSPDAVLIASEYAPKTTETQRILLNKLDENTLDDFSAYQLLEIAHSEEIQEAILTKMSESFDHNSIRDAFEHAKSEKIQQQILSTSLESVDDFNCPTLLEHAKSEEIQEIVLNQIQDNTLIAYDVTKSLEAAKSDKIKGMIIDRIEDNAFEHKDVRGAIIEAGKNEYVIKILDKSKTPTDLDSMLEHVQMKVLFRNEQFLTKVNEMDAVESWSVGVSVARYLKKQGKDLNSQNIAEATDKIIDLRNQHGGRVLLGSSTNFIPVTHEEKWAITGDYRFQEDKLVEFALDSGVKEENIVKGLKGPEAKSNILDSIKQSTGATTVYFNNHGGPDHQWLSQGTAGTEYTDIMKHPDAISYIELGDALIERTKSGQTLSDMNIMIDSCHAYDFASNLYNYLETKGVSQLPVITTETNRGQVGYSITPTDEKVQEYGIYSEHLYQLKKQKQSGTPLTLNDFFKADRSKKEDGAVFIPSDTGVDALGSSDDDTSLPTTLDEEKPDSKKQDINELTDDTTQSESTDKPTTVIEISKITNEGSQEVGFA